MRYMILLKYDEPATFEVPSELLINEMGMFNAAMEKAGILRAGEGLLPSSVTGARVTVTDKEREVTDGPFAETKELVAGFWIVDVSGLDEAVEWARRVPNPRPGGTAVLEVRRVVEADDLGDNFTPEARAAEERMRARIAELG
jgi:hypothetical protein